MTSKQIPISKGLPPETTKLTAIKSYKLLLLEACNQDCKRVLLAEMEIVYENENTPQVISF